MDISHHWPVLANDCARMTEVAFFFLFLKSDLYTARRSNEIHGGHNYLVLSHYHTQLLRLQCL
jgi:hypothetical protein